MLSNADIVVVNQATSSARREKVFVPAHYSNAGIMAVHATKLAPFFNIPDLDLPSAKTDTDVGTVSTPFDTADIGIR